MPLRREDIIAAAKAQLKKRYSNGGRGVIVDCMGMILAAADILKYPYVDWPCGYALNELADEIIPQLEKFTDRIPIEERRPGDIATFWFNRHTRRTEHVGWLTPDGIIHTYEIIGEVVENNLDERWIKRMTAVFRLRGVVD